MRIFRTIVRLLRDIHWGKLLLWALATIFAALVITAIYAYPNPIPGKKDRDKENAKALIVNDVTELNPVKVQGIVVPHTIEEIAEAVRAHDKVSIGGGRNSMGGQTASEKAVQIDMRAYNKILALSTSTKEITVQAGARWRDIQDAIDPYGLSVKIMQTYSNFTVGGSLSVNVHGRYIGLGPIILSVKNMRLVLADGSIVEASPTQNRDLFYSVIGGMGGIAVISDATLELADNVNVERKRNKVATEDYYEYFKREVRDSEAALFHNGDMYPPEFESVSAVTWSVTDKEPTTKERLIPKAKDYWVERIAWLIMSEWPYGRSVREYVIDPVLYRSDAVHTRNYEASYDIAELEPNNRERSTYVLQEYFVPVERFDEWVPKMKKVFNDNDVNVINVSIRHALPDSGAILAWAPTESFAFVVYYKQGTDEESKEKVGMWTRQMIDAVLSVGGTYYLPYQLHATDDHLHRAYPRMTDYFDIKRKYDPTNKFTNKLWDTYFSDEKLAYYKERKEITELASTTKDYFRPYDNAYLSIPEWYIVYSADEYAATLTHGKPSEFRYWQAVRDYWSQYKNVTTRVLESPHDNSGYLTVLNVIGVSFSAENVLKAFWEGSIGRMSEQMAGRRVPEDDFAARAAADYAEFIYDYPWYDFPYQKYLEELWELPDGAESRGAAFRRTERKLILSLELLAKTGYGKLIRFATHSKFGIQDDVIAAIVEEDGKRRVIAAPHYHPFTRLLLSEMGSARAKGKEITILDIAGNTKITFSYVDAHGASPVANTREILRDAELRFDSNRLRPMDRITVEVAVADLYSVYRDLAKRELRIEHFYDY